MSNETFRLVCFLFLGGAFVAILAALAFLTMAMVGWRTPLRNGWLARFAVLTIVAGALFATPWALLHLVMIPSWVQRSQQERRERLDAASLTKEADLAPAFKTETDEGKEFSLTDQRGKVVLVNFFATWCGPCLQELPHLQELWNEHKDRNDFSLIVIGREETDDAVKAFKKKRGFTFPIAADPDRAVYSLFAKESIPRTYLISREGKVVLSETGFAGEEHFGQIKTAVRRELSK